MTAAERPRRAGRLLALLIVTFLLLPFAVGAGAFSGQPTKRDYSVTYCAASEPAELGSLQELDDELESAVDSWDSAAGTTVASALAVWVYSPGSNCLAGVIVRSIDYSSDPNKNWLAGFGFEGGQGYITLNDQYPWSTNGAAGTYDVGDVLAHEIGHTFGLGHSGVGGFWNKNANDPTMMGGGELGTEAGETIEVDDKGGASWARDGIFWSANPGFEIFRNGWTSSGVVTVGTGTVSAGPYSGPRRAQLDPGSYIKTVATYDPWDTNTEDNDLYDGMSYLPVISFTGWVRDRDTVAGSGEVALQYKYRYFEYSGNVPKGQGNPQIIERPDTDGWSGWITLDSDPPAQVYSQLGYHVMFYLPKYEEGGVSVHRAVQLKIRVKNNHNSKILLDEAGMSGGI